MKPSIVYKYLTALSAGFVAAWLALQVEKIFDFVDADGNYYLMFLHNYFMISLVEEFSKFFFVILFFLVVKERSKLLYFALAIGLGFSIFEEGNYIIQGNYFDQRLFIPFFLHIFLTMIQMYILTKIQFDSINKYFYLNTAWIFTWILHGFYDMAITLAISWAWISIYSMIALFSLYIWFKKPKLNLLSDYNKADNEEDDFGFFK